MQQDERVGRSGLCELLGDYARKSVDVQMKIRGCPDEKMPDEKMKKMKAKVVDVQTKLWMTWTPIELGVSLDTHRSTGTAQQGT